jgi:glycosyltransferase involved in cell wall biosynthesis
VIPVISVIIPHLNQPDMLKRCLTSLMEGRRLPDEIIVVDNGSAVMPQAVCDATPGCTLLRQDTPGPGPARNLGIAQASGDVFAFIDADCLADPLWLSEAEAAMADPANIILGGDVRIAYVDPENLTLLEAYESIYAYRMDKYIANEGFTGTGNLVVRRAIMERVGAFGGLNIAEDIDWGKRATGMGLTITYVAGMRAYHPAREHYSQLRAKWDRHIAHFYTKARAGRFGTAKWLARAVAMALSPIWEIGQIATSDRISGLRNRGLAFVGLARIRLYRARMMLAVAISGDPDALSGRWNRPATPPTATDES